MCPVYGSLHSFVSVKMSSYQESSLMLERDELHDIRSNCPAHHHTFYQTVGTIAMPFDSSYLVYSLPWVGYEFQHPANSYHTTAFITYFVHKWKTHLSSILSEHRMPHSPDFSTGTILTPSAWSRSYVKNDRKMSCIKLIFCLPHCFKISQNKRKRNSFFDFPVML